MPKPAKSSRKPRATKTAPEPRQRTRITQYYDGERPNACPVCAAHDSFVNKTGKSETGGFTHVRRRRECCGCAHVFSTLQHIKK